MKRDKKFAFGNLQNTAFIPGVIVGALGDSDISNKESHDSYRVFVNGDYIGDKVLVSQNEEVEEIDDYLKHNEFTNYTTLVEGNRYLIKEEDRDQAHRMKDHLQVYLNIR